jgi:hypothetical protein
MAQSGSRGLPLENFRNCHHLLWNLHKMKMITSQGRACFVIIFIMHEQKKKATMSRHSTDSSLSSSIAHQNKKKTMISLTNLS